MATVYKLGKECTFSVGNTPWNKVKEIRVEMGGSEVDLSTRGSSIKQTAIALREITISGTALYSPDDSIYTQLKDAYDSGSALEITLSDPTLTYTGKWCVTALTNPQPLEDVLTIDFTLKPTLEKTTQ